MSVNTPGAIALFVLLPVFGIALVTWCVIPIIQRNRRLDRFIRSYRAAQGRRNQPPGGKK